MIDILALTIAAALFFGLRKLRRTRRHKQLIKTNAYAYVAARREPKWGDAKKEVNRRSGTHQKRCKYRRRAVVNQGDCTCVDMRYWSMTFARAIQHDVEVTTQDYTAEDLQAFKQHYQDALTLDALRTRTIASIETFTVDLEAEERRHAENLKKLRASEEDEFDQLLAS